MCECFDVVTPELKGNRSAGPYSQQQNARAVFLLGFQKRVHQRSNSSVISISHSK
jgi:hypothetical protein